MNGGKVVSKICAYLCLVSPQNKKEKLDKIEELKQKLASIPTKIENEKILVTQDEENVKISYLINLVKEPIKLHISFIKKPRILSNVQHMSSL